MSKENLAWLLSEMAEVIAFRESHFARDCDIGKQRRSPDRVIHVGSALKTCAGLRTVYEGACLAVAGTGVSAAGVDMICRPESAEMGRS